MNYVSVCPWLTRWLTVGVMAGLFLIIANSNVLASPHSQTTTPVAGIPIQSLDDVGRAVVRIEVIGLFQAADEPETTHLKVGTGFLIDPSGLILTNNHVVAGGRAILVYLHGEERPHYASIVSLSECSDLALLALRGRDYPYLRWSTGAPERGTDIYAFGFASGTLARSDGVIQDVQVDFESNIASSLETVVHTAAVSPGDSGGPLTDDKGQVIGVNYGGNYGDGSSRTRSVTISAREAQEIIAKLQRSPVSESLGISGEAWSEDKRPGIWISAVQPGSPAWAAGLQAGDMLLTLDGDDVSDGRSMAAYCSHLREWDRAEPLTYEVLVPGRRGATRTGQIVSVYARRALGEISFSRQTIDGLEFLRPTAWSDTLSEVDDEDGHRHWEAAPDLTLFADAVGGASLVIELFDDEFPNAETSDILDFIDYADVCESTARFPHIHTVRAVTYEGFYDHWQGCSDGRMDLYSLLLRSRPDGQIIFATYLSLANEDDLAFGVFRHSFQPDEKPGNVQGPAASTARILVAALNVRSGPGTGYAKIGSLAQDEQVGIVGRNDACTWLQIALPTGGVGWIAANASYVLFGVSCAEIPVKEVESLPSASIPGPQPAAPARPSSGESETLDSSLGCYLFENQIGAEVTVTFTRQDQPWNSTFTILGNQSYAHCLEPGIYTYTLDAPPPWNSINGELTVAAGDRFRFPIRRQ